MDERTELTPRPRARPTQAERLLAWARKGNRLHQDDWWNETPDGLGPIKALRTKISQIEARGYQFDHVYRRGRLAEYRLVGEPPDVQPQSTGEVAARTSVVAEIEQFALELPPANPPARPATSAIYGEGWDR